MKTLTTFFTCLFASAMLYAQPYCDAAGDPGTGSDYIAKVKSYTLSNVSQKTQYSDFTSLEVEYIQGGSYPITVELAFSFDLDVIGVWIDYNQNFEFEETERVDMSGFTNHISEGVITIPTDATLGSTRMRVRSIYTPTAMYVACDTIAGEVEDYTVIIKTDDCSTVGMPCDDGLDCTIDDTIDANCNCIGSFDDLDEDGVCDELDICRGFHDLLDQNNNGLIDGCEDYCPAMGASGTGGDWINRVRLYDINHSSQKSQYSDFTDQKTELVQGGFYELFLHLNFAFDPDIAFAWIDYNQNKIFEESEEITMDDFNSSAISTGFFEVPTDALLGPTRMRVRNIYEQGPHDYEQCFEHAGEVEDYTIEIIADTCPNVGDNCDDGLDCTTNDEIDQNCNCRGQMIDDDYDGICNEDDICPGEDDGVDADMNGVWDCLEYCQAFGSDGTAGDYISEVLLSTLYNESDQSDYSDFTNLSVLLERNESYVLAIVLNQVFLEDQAMAWIDYDHNQRFEEHERIFMEDYSVDATSVGSFIVPTSALTGCTRMRVRNIYNPNQVVDPCNEYFGEVEDYTVCIDIIDNIPSLTEKINLAIHPNPTSQSVKITLDENRESRLEIYDLLGNRIFIYTGKMTSKELDISQYEKGIYFVKLTDELTSRSVVKKMIVQ